MMHFFYLIDHIDSAMLVDQENCPHQPLPLHPDSVALYLRYKCEKKGNILQKLRSGDQMLDVSNHPIFCEGGWNSPSSLWKFHAAILFLHKNAYPMTCSGPYKLSCLECQCLNNNQTMNTTTATLIQNTGTEETNIIDDNNLTNQTLESRIINLNKSYGLFQSCPCHANNC